MKACGGPATPHRSHTQRSRHRIRPCKLRVGCRTVWCARHLQQLGPPWGYHGAAGGNLPIPHGHGRTLFAFITWGGPHPPPCKALDQTRRSGHHIRPFELRFGCRTVVRTSSSAARPTMGTVGNVPYPRGGKTLLGHLGGPQSNTTKTTFGVANTAFEH